MKHCINHAVFTKGCQGCHTVNQVVRHSEFKPGAPKPATSIAFVTLKLSVSETNKPTGAKRIDGNSIKVFMSGHVNHYVADSKKLREFLAKYNVEI